ncbi:RHS repeat-associated core domain-containing protein [Flavobacterium segetis]|uniref:RHS repeat-associated core domain-containing protein n=1 Tax=Flavobacterium segetis TaxID=271157 RepID=A0A1M5F4Z0_9FLAO|nr:RHS repeat-associated core domain-containing protein [Flavobacterium segetis]
MVFDELRLGSTSYISTRNGSISQHVEYIAFGEVLFEEHVSSFSSPYLFNGKELDRETNLSYYGARYLDMKTSLWLNVDPPAEKFPSMSPYNFCFNNPLIFVDPDGRAPDWHEDANNKNVLIKDKGDNAETLREYVNKNDKDADLTKSASETLYSSMKDNKVNIDKLNPETLNQNKYNYNYPGSDKPDRSDMSTTIAQIARLCR